MVMRLTDENRLLLFCLGTGPSEDQMRKIWMKWNIISGEHFSKSVCTPQNIIQRAEYLQLDKVCTRMQYGTMSAFWS